jgi:hypothetical protein
LLNIIIGDVLALKLKAIKIACEKGFIKMGNYTLTGLIWSTIYPKYMLCFHNIVDFIYQERIDELKAVF